MRQGTTASITAVLRKARWADVGDALHVMPRNRTVREASSGRKEAITEKKLAKKKSNSVSSRTAPVTRQHSVHD